MAPPKLTKKQKKGLAFRERKSQKSSGALQEEELAVPELDLLAEDEQPNESKLNTQSHQTDLETKKENEKSTNLGKRKREDGVEDRKAEAEAKETVTKQPTLKKKRRKVSENKAESTTDGEAGNNKSESKDNSKSRFILFVGNLKYTTSLEAIQEHFSKCDPPPTIRLLTPKPKTTGLASAKSKGCAFLEFSHRNALQQGLKLHASTLDGRRINVELTAGGGGKSENRVKKVQERNKQLIEQRKEIVQKKVDAGESIDTIVVAPPQRHSTTSGLDHVPQQKRTWSIPQGDETAGKGGTKKRGKKTSKPSRTWGTGANAITVG